MKKIVNMKRIAAALITAATASFCIFGVQAETLASPAVKAVRPESSEAYQAYISGDISFDENGVKPSPYVPSGTVLQPSGSLPASYKTITTPIRTQGSYNTCWAFSGIGAMEAFLSHDGKGDHDLSENHLAWWSTKAYNSSGIGWQMNDLDYGGYSKIHAGYFASWQGPKTESELPYYNSGNNDVPYNMDDSYTIYGATGMIYVNNDITSIKTAIYKYGGIATSYNNGNGYNSDRSAYYQGGTATRFSGHAITVIGWDDNYSRNNFDASDRPEGDGAWLIKNSWGDGVGDNGYLWVSYYDRYIFDVYTWGANIAFTSVRTMNNYDRLYQNEKYGATFYTFLMDDNYDYLESAVFANVFDFDDEHTHLQEVIFETQTTDANYEIYYIPLKNGKPDKNESSWTFLTRGKVDHTGYICADVSGTIDVGGKAAIGVRITAPEYDFAKFGVDEWFMDDQGTYLFMPEMQRNKSFVIANNNVYDMVDVYGANDDKIGGLIVLKAVASSYVAGDADGDGIVSADDALAVLREAVGLGAGLTQIQVDSCDVSYDGILTSEDALLILRKSSELLGEF